MNTVPDESVAAEPELSLGLLRTMLEIRHVEDAWGAAYLTEEIDGIPPSLSTGQEAVSAGACAALEDGDFVFTTHRGQAPQVARGLSAARILAEVYCRRTGYNKGKSYHVTDVDSGVIGMGGIVGAQVPIAGGMALAQKMDGNGRVSVAFYGDGGSNEGAIHEAANLAAMWDLPLILLCENNGYCITQKVGDAVKAPSIADRAIGYGMPGEVVDGNDALAMHDAVTRAVKRGRSGGGPTLIEARTLRLAGHLVHDQQGYRPADELAKGWENCPIRRLKDRLINAGLMSPDEFAALEAAVNNEVEEANDFARNSPYPDIEEARDDIWA